MTLLKISLRIEDLYLKYRGNLEYYLVADENKRTFTKLNNMNTYTKQNDLLLTAYDINESPIKYYIQVLDIDNNLFCIFNCYGNYTRINLEDNFINYKSPIISATITITKDNIAIYDEYDITNSLNNFINYNCLVNLSNNNKYKKIWIYYFNYIFTSVNAYINYDNIDDIKLSWTIMNDNMDVITGDEIEISVNNGIFDINKLI
jgi:hypothetical protein